MHIVKTCNAHMPIYFLLKYDFASDGGDDGSGSSSNGDQSLMIGVAVGATVAGVIIIVIIALLLYKKRFVECDFQIDLLPT